MRYLFLILLLCVGAGATDTLVVKGVVTGKVIRNCYIQVEPSGSLDSCCLYDCEFDDNIPHKSIKNSVVCRKPISRGPAKGWFVGISSYIFVNCEFFKNID